jgi:uncharacterized protein (TIRG00374 family)
VFIVYFFLNIESFKPLLEINPLYLIAIAVCDLLVIFANGSFTKIILKPFGKHISYLEAFYVSLISSVGNFFAPVGAGFGFRAVYLKKKHNFAYSDFLSTLYGNYLIIFLINSILGLVCLFLLKDKVGGNYYILTIVFAAIFVISLMLTIFKIPKKLISYFESKKRLAKLFKVIVAMSKGWNSIVSNKKLMLKLIGIALFNFLLSIIIAKLIITSLGMSVGIIALVFFSVLGSLSLFINITPANLGVKELIYIFSLSVVGFSIDQVLMIALVDRGILFFIMLISWLVMGRLKNLTSYKLLDGNRSSQKKEIR